jgi:hypothetical protein
MSASPAGLIASIEHIAEPIRPTAADMSGPKPDLEARAREIYQQHHSAGRRLSGAAVAVRSAPPNATADACSRCSAPRTKAPAVATATAQHRASR